MIKEDLQNLAKIYDKKTLQETIVYLRNSPKLLDRVTSDSFLPNDSTRQLFRRAMRYAIDTPDIEWQDVFNENKP